MTVEILENCHVFSDDKGPRPRGYVCLASGKRDCRLRNRLSPVMLIMSSTEADLSEISNVSFDEKVVPRKSSPFAGCFELMVDFMAMVG